MRLYLELRKSARKKSRELQREAKTAYRGRLQQV